MTTKPVYIWYREIKHKKPSGQIVAVLTIIIAIIFLFIAITINIGKVSQTKTALNIAADGAALTLASSLGSLGHYFKETKLDGKEKDCKFNWWLIFCPIIGLLVGGILGLIIGAVAGGLYTGIKNYFDARNLDRQFAKMTAEVRYQQAAISYALFRTVDDPQLIQDEHDYDEDTKTTDLIPRFMAWYARRILDIADRMETLEYYIDLILPHLRGMDEALHNCSEYAAGEPDDPDYPEGTAFKGMQSQIESGITYGNAELDYNDPNGNLTDPANIIVRRYDETIKMDFPFWEPQAYNDTLDYFITLSEGFHAWAWGVQSDEPDPLTGKIEFIPGVVNMSKTALIDTFYSWYGRLLVWDKDFNAYMKPIRCWVKCYWGWERGSEGPKYECDSDCPVGEVIITSGGNQQIIPDDLYDVLTKKIEDMRWEQGQLKDKRKELEKILEGITDPTLRKPYEDKITELREAIWAIDTSIADVLEDYKTKINEASQDKFGGARGGIYGMEVFLHGDSEAEPPTTGIDPQIQQALAALADLNKATYSWDDSLGWHHVRAEVSEFKVPTINSWSTWYGSVCGELLNARGNITVKVTRFDQDKEVKLSSGAKLWNFRMRSNPQEETNFDPQDAEAALARGITSSATAKYGPDHGDIKILSGK